MFAVPGWSISASSLKTQTVEPSKPTRSTVPTTNEIGNGDHGSAAAKPSKKRKRSSGKSKAQDVNPSNLTEMWESVIEGRPKEKMVKSRTVNVESGVVGEGQERGEDIAPKEKREKKHKKQKTLKEKRREKKAAAITNNDTKTLPTKPPTAVPTAPPSTIPRPETKLTPLQASMRQKLISARFRHLNETLYTKPSTHSLTLFAENPEMFTEYHEGFRRQVEVWPENPVDSYIAAIKSRGKIRGPSRGEKNALATGESERREGDWAPLPRTQGICTIADLGCGEAVLSSTLSLLQNKLHIQIHSFDLHCPSPLVTKADIAHLPLGDGSVDVAIFCLALMGTNWVEFVEEAWRVLRWKGELWVAEIKSRFGRAGPSTQKGAKVVDHSVGKRKRPLDRKEKKKLDEQAEDHLAAVEVDGAESTSQTTDVSAFVEVLRKRGFLLRPDAKGGVEGAVDLSNKMFVKMQFVKGLTPIKGKCVPVPQGMEQMGIETWNTKPKRKFIDDDGPGEEHVRSEAGVLKPCVYKLR